MLGLHPEHVTKRFARLVRDAGLAPITLRGVRHSYATAALAAGEPLKVVSERLGHASTSITANLDQHVLPSMDERTANAVANLILGDRRPDAESPAVNPLSPGPGVHEVQEGGEARPSSSGGSVGGADATMAYGSSESRLWCRGTSRCRRCPLVARLRPLACHGRAARRGSPSSCSQAPRGSAARRRIGASQHTATRSESSKQCHLDEGVGSSGARQEQARPCHLVV
jgi:hypothetical protein